MTRALIPLDQGLNSPFACCKENTIDHLHFTKDLFFGPRTLCCRLEQWSSYSPVPLRHQLSIHRRSFRYNLTYSGGCCWRWWWRFNNNPPAQTICHWTPLRIFGWSVVPLTEDDVDGQNNYRDNKHWPIVNDKTVTPLQSNTPQKN